MLFELVLSKVGEAVAKSILKAWLGESGLVTDVGGSVLEIIGRLSLDLVLRRRLEREFHQVADRIAENIFPFFEIEGARLSEGDKVAVVTALGNSLNVTNVSSLVLIKKYDLRASKLASALRDNAAGELKFFSADAISLYERLSSECATYILEISARLPTFSPAVFGELLQRQNMIDGTVTEVLAEIRKLTETTRTYNVEEEAGKFERRYRNAIAHRNDEVELFGLDAPSRIRRQNLRVAYITLSMTRRNPKRKKGSAQESEISGWTSDVSSLTEKQTALLEAKTTGSDWLSKSWTKHGALDESGNAESCDAILETTNRLLIRGEAGSGKTTLLQWVTVNTASQRLGERLASWNDLVPFFVKLRQYAEKPLPSPRGLIADVLPEVADGIPEKWVENVLSSGRAIILLDGVDELDALKREEVRTWVKALVSAFPNCRFILTSRMTAVEEDWLGEQKFEEAELLPMTWPDIDNLIDHWHEALALQPGLDESAEQLTPVANQLKKQLRLSRALSDLATSPLLCAMLCALHYERRQQLPPNRIVLYDSAIRMLLHQRDRARGIGGLSLPNLSEEQKRAYLEHLAYWMLRNGFAVTTVTDATAEIARTTPYVQGLPSDSAPARVLELLIQRSGMIRSPAEGYIDFVHKTFQEFLGAKAIVDAADLQFLISHAHEDQWHETVVLAAGLAPQNQRDSFLQSLVSRGDAEYHYRHTLYLLAVACLETAVKLSPDVERLLDDRIQAVIPPRNLTEARSLKAAGVLAVPLLRRRGSYTARESAAAVRALALIGGEDALAALESYSEDIRKTVVRELVGGWNYFESDEYASRILANNSLDNGALYLSDARHLASLHLLRKLTDLAIGNSSSIASLADLSKLTGLARLNLHGASKLKSLEGLKALTNLTTLELWTSKLESFAGIEERPTLQMVTLSTIANCRELFGPSTLPKLKFLYLGGRSDDLLWKTGDRFHSELTHYGANVPISDLRLFTNCARLRSLRCTLAEDVHHLDVLANKSSLKQLIVRLNSNRNLDWIADLKALELLNLINVGESDLAPVYQLGKLQYLEIGGAAFVDLDQGFANKNMEKIELYDSKTSARIPDLSDCKQLKIVTLRNVRGLQNVSGLKSAPNLQQVVIYRCPEVQDLAAIEDLRSRVYAHIIH